MIKAPEWLESQTERLDASIDKKRESESDRVQAKADQLEEIKGELEEMQGDIETCSAAGAEMMTALCEGNLTSAFGVIDAGCIRFTARLGRGDHRSDVDCAPDDSHRRCRIAVGPRQPTAVSIVCLDDHARIPRCPGFEHDVWMAGVALRGTTDDR